MFTYNPKLHHAMITAAICMLCFAATAYTQKPPIVKSWMIGFWIFLTLTAVVVVMLIISSFNSQTDSQTYWMKEYNKLDDEGKAEMASHFPTIRFRMWRGMPHAFWEDTNVSMEHLKIFLDTSDKFHISPERNWNSAKMPRRIWLEIKDNLEADGKVKPDSAAGSHSWEWIGNSYKDMLLYRMAGRELKYKDNPAGQVYAYEEDEPELV